MIFAVNSVMFVLMIMTFMSLVGTTLIPLYISLYQVREFFRAHEAIFSYLYLKNREVYRPETLYEGNICQGRRFCYGFSRCENFSAPSPEKRAPEVVLCRFCQAQLEENECLENLL